MATALTAWALAGIALACAGAVRADLRLPNPFKKHDEIPPDPFEVRTGWATPPPNPSTSPNPPAPSAAPPPASSAAASSAAAETAPSPPVRPASADAGYRAVAQRIEPPGNSPSAPYPPAAVPARNIPANIEQPVSAPPPVVTPPGYGDPPAAAPPAAAPPAAGPPRRGPVAPPAPQVIARVGDEPILDVEIMGAVNQKLAQEIRPDMTEQEFQGRRLELIQQALDQLIEQRLVVMEARRSIPAEKIAGIEKSLTEQFEKTTLKDLMQKTKARSRSELEAIMQQSGTSIERQKRMYFDRNVTHFWIRQHIDYEPEVTHEEMIAYYQQHRGEFTKPGRARWEELVVRFDADRSKDEAWQAIATLGNDILRGVPWAEVAKAGSQGITAQDGGVRDWATRGSLASNVLNEALFALPVGQPSRILEDRRGLTILRVLEREEDKVQAFHDAQIDIKDKIRKQKVDKQIQQYVTKLRKRIPVWTALDAANERERNRE